MAPRRKSQAEIEALGNAGRLSKAEIAARAASHVPLVGTPESVAANPFGDIPAYLSDLARDAWMIAAPALQAVSLLAAPDRIAFGRYCEWLARYFEMTRSAKKLRPVQNTTSRAVKMQRIDKHFQALLMLDKRLCEYEAAFGMTPAARQAIFAKLANGYSPANKGAQPGLGPQAGGNAEPKKPNGPIGFLKTGARPPGRLQ